MSNPSLIIATLLTAIAASAATVSNSHSATPEKTAESQVMTEQEVEMTRLIRERITDNHDLSIRAHNIKIITEKNRVYLKGPVASKEERRVVEKIAHKAADGSKVVNETYVEE